MRLRAGGREGGLYGEAEGRREGGLSGEAEGEVKGVRPVW